MTRLPALLPEAERTPAILTHLSPLAGLLLPTLGNILGPLIAWLALRDRSRALDEQGKEALNFQLSVWLYGLVLGVLAFVLFSLGLIGGAVGAVTRPELAGLAVLGTFSTFFLFYLPVMVVLGLIPFVFMIVAVVRVSAGQPYHYPLTIRFLR
ncbi:DUF4870 domain-containing protein [Deinococcus sp. HMF7620]|uniref:DUF4870 domain-containing protein n=1 Tax=Deinococcus arboris TaxID=2682977 RepID=A0A7C9MSH7_9DEIO|nr:MULTISPECIES: DUF4870 domain-containing protein [Deinococcus]MBZ9752431.1 DUF4870 domain-containing protein [Deinococcus betulae]MVN88044.1 DUF4870 domain-containing protein [Deinococcus arboris]